MPIDFLQRPAFCCQHHTEDQNSIENSWVHRMFHAATVFRLVTTTIRSIRTMNNASPLLRSACLATLGVCILTSCDKTRKIANSFGFNTSSRPPVAYQGALVTELDKTTYEKFPDQPGRVVMVDFHADWCGPCRKLGPSLEKIAKEHKGLVLIGKVNVDTNKEIAAKEGVSGIPDVRVYRDGKLIDQFVGAPGESKLREQVKDYVKGLAPIPESATTGASPGQPGSTITPMSKDWLPPGMSRR